MRPVCHASVSESLSVCQIVCLRGGVTKERYVCLSEREQDLVMRCAAGQIGLRGKWEKCGLLEDVVAVSVCSEGLVSVCLCLSV